MSAGYSGTPLIKKLGIKPGMLLSFVNTPSAFETTLGVLPDGLVWAGPRAKGLDLVLLFVTREAELQLQFAKLAPRLAPAGMLWVGWPKKAAKLASDLSDNVVRRVGLNAGLVDIKVCAIDEVWSGLKFVIPIQSRVQG
jgi:hypothetical protein